MAKQQVKYEKRIVAYIDMLGFKEIIDQTLFSSGRDNRKAIKYLLLTYKRLKHVFKQEYHTVARRKPWIFPLEKNSKKVTTFSDSVVISFEYKKDDPKLFSDVITDIFLMIKELIWRGVLCRGAITVGKLIHTPSVVFGPGLVEAYLKESKEAKYPRVIIDDKVMLLIENEIKKTNHPDSMYLDDYIKTDFDGKWFLDYFSIHSIVGPPMLGDVDWLYLKFLADKILDGLNLSEESMHNHLFEKYDWMLKHYNANAEYYNSDKFYKAYYGENGGFSKDNPEYEPPGIIVRS